MKVLPTCLFSFFIFLVCTIAAPHSATAQNPTKHRVVMQFTTSDTAAHRALMNQLKNVIEGFGQENLEMEVICHNRGLDLLMKNSPFADKIAEFQQKGIKFYACRQTLIQRNIKEEDLVTCPIVPRGLVWIIERQEQGWSYIKGGF
ncbi:MAG: DsrE family protein [Cytophagales bacterium]|nr:DsrE family protein [Bernardetiaceae bacterium]MDW8204166.1 DsrE family protein [Cytophagales bacterium]